MFLYHDMTLGLDNNVKHYSVVKEVFMCLKVVLWNYKTTFLIAS